MTDVVVHDPPMFDRDIGGSVVKETDQWFMAVVPMIFNDRIVFGTQEERRRSYSYGWCYDKGGAAALAALAWDPDTHDEPVGYKKAVGEHHRRR